MWHQSMIRHFSTVGVYLISLDLGVELYHNWLVELIFESEEWGSWLLPVTSIPIMVTCRGLENTRAKRFCVDAKYMLLSQSLNHCGLHSGWYWSLLLHWILWSSQGHWRQHIRFALLVDQSRKSRGHAYFRKKYLLTYPEAMLNRLIGIYF